MAMSLTVVLIFFINCYSFTAGEVLPPANLAFGRQFEASSICGQVEPEEYCYSESNGVLIFDGCYVCNALSSQFSRGIENINDEKPLQSGDITDQADNNTVERTWWQSANGVNNVTIELKFEQKFDLLDINIDFRSLRPASGFIEISTDFGISYERVQYYSDKCLEDFGVAADAVVESGEAGCTSNYTSPSPGTLSYVASDSSLTAVTNVRLRLLRINTAPEYTDFVDMLQHYAIYDFEALGICPCMQMGLICACDEEVSIITTPPAQSCDLLGVTGPICNSCVTGYYNFSESIGCQPCSCNLEGILDSICDPETGQCDCASGVLGPHCDTCPTRSIGPSRFTENRCTSCFCNGYSTMCEPADGWYQAQVISRSFDQKGGSGFKSNGVIKNNSYDFLEVEASAESPGSMIVSFPKDYIGDKRTAYNQHLMVTISFPHLNKSLSSDLIACLEVIGQTVRYPQVRIIWSLKVDDIGTEPKLFEVPLVSGKADLVPYFSTFRGRLAKTKEIREVLTNIQTMRLVISSKPQTGRPLTLRLYSSSLSFAVNNSSSSFAIQPIEPVSYVELCTQCPSSRTGVYCEQCMDGYTVDPGNGGEFARCVECFCNFRSDSCHPVSGECSNCTGNTFGVDCEQCLPGYARQMPLTLLSCDQCADGYWDPGNGTCTSCSCNLAGSINNNCNKSTGVCVCRENVVGDSCDACVQGTSQIFPSCEPCDECTEQWLRRIIPLGDQIQGTIKFASSLNLSNTTQDIPLLDTLFELAQEIEEVLRNSSIDVLTSDVEAFNARLNLLINQTQDFIVRGETVQAELDRIEMDTQDIGINLLILTNSLAQLRADFENVSMIFQSQDFISVNSTPYVDLACTALERSNAADQLVQENVTTLLNETVAVLDMFNANFEENDAEEINEKLEEALEDINSTLEELQAFTSVASQKLCGTGNDTCLECANDTCGICPAGIRCDGLIATADLAFNLSSGALVIAEELLEQIMTEVRALEELLKRARGTKRGVEEVVNFVSEIRNTSQELFENIRSLTDELERELNASRVDPKDIVRLENATLSLELDLLPNEFFDLLVEINSTIDAFFAGSGVNDIELRERTDATLTRAQRANELAMEVAANATALRQLIAELMEKGKQLEGSVNRTNSLVNETDNTLEQAATLLGNTETSVNRSRNILSNISERLIALELQIQQNRVGVEEARNLTSIAQVLADHVANDSVALEGEYRELRYEALQTLNQSEQDYEAVLDIQNRTLTVLQLTQQQILDVERFERTKNSLIMEQELTRGNVLRVVSELEELESEIQKHVARNTGCLDGPVLSKRK